MGKVLNRTFNIFPNKNRGQNFLCDRNIASNIANTVPKDILRGDYVDIDMSDGSGMNLLDIRNHKWSIPCLNACAPNLSERLGNPIPTTTIVGTIHSYFVK